MGGGTPTTLEEVVQEEIAPFASEAATSDIYEKKFEELEQEVGRVIDVDDLKQVLGEFNQTVKSWLDSRAENSAQTIGIRATEARERILKAAEEARQRITSVGLDNLCSRIEALFSDGKPNAAIIEWESNASGQDAQDIRKALNTVVLEQAESSQRLNKPNAARYGIKDYASDDLVKQDMKQVLDNIVLASVIASEEQAKPNAARNTIDSCASSQEVAIMMRAVLDSRVYSAAEAMQRQNKPNAARGRVEDASRIDVESRMNQALDIFILQQAEELKNAGKPNSASQLIQKASSSLVRSKIAEVLQL